MNRSDDSGGQQVFLTQLGVFVSIGIMIILLTFSLYGISYHYFGKHAIAAVSSFGASASSILTIVLLIVYLRQTRILERHQRELKEQSELMGLTHLPDISVIDADIHQEDDSIEVILKNRGKGAASELELVTCIETPDNVDQDSSMSGSSALYRVNPDGGILEDQTLPGGDEAKFQAEPVIEKPLTHGDPTTCSIREIVQTIHREGGNWVRIELKIQPYMQNGEPAKPVSALPHDSTFRVELSRIESTSESDYSLQRLRNASTPV